MSKEVKDIVKEEEKNSGVGTYTFKKPTKVDGEAITEIAYDFTEINGRTIRAAKSDLQRRGYTVAVKELDECFHAAIFAQATGISLDDVERFSAIDYMAVADLARDFLNSEE